MLVSAAWIVPALLGAVDTLAQQQLWGGPPVSPARLIFAGADWFLYAFLTPLVFAIARHWPLTRPHLARRAILHLAFSLLFCVAWAGAGTLLKLLLSSQPLEGGTGLSFASWIFTTLPFGVAVYLAMVGIEHAIRYFTEARDRDLQVARLSEQLAGARFAALQAQLNPHFLFNTLNTITVLVRDGDTAAATRMVEQLSDILRRTLNRHRANEVPLAEELELVRQYLAIEQARFSDRLHPAFVVDEAALAGAVPGFALQHLVENAVRHGIARRPEAGRLMVTARREGDALLLSVTDDGPGAGTGIAPPGHGIQNTRDRLDALYGEGASLALSAASPVGTVATLRIPWRELAVDPGRAKG